MVIVAAGSELVKGFHESFSSYHKPGDVLELTEALQEVGSTADDICIVPFFSPFRSATTRLKS